MRAVERGVRLRGLPLALVLLIALSACAVTTPRHQARGVGSGSDLLNGGNAAAGDTGQTSQDQALSGGGLVQGGSTGSRSRGVGSGVTGSGVGGGTQAGRAGTSSSGSTSAPGVTKDSITVSVSLMLSGPIGALTQQGYNDGYMTWAKQVNDHGGIHGRRVVLQPVDNKGTADGAIGACKEEQSNNSFLVVLQSGLNPEADCLDKAGIPVVFDGAQGINPSWRLTHVLASYADSGHPIASWVANRLSGRSLKVGVIIAQYPQLEVAEKDFVAKAPSFGLNVVDVESVAQNQSSYTSELLRMQQKGVQLIVNIVAFEIVGILRDANAINYHPVMTGWGWVIDELSQGGFSLFNGIRALRTWATVNSPAYPAYQQAVKQYGANGGAGAGATFMDFYGKGEILGQLLDAAGPTPTTASLLSAFKTFDHWDDQINPPVTWSHGEIVGMPGMFPAQCCNSDETWHGIGPAELDF